VGEFRRVCLFRIGEKVPDTQLQEYQTPRSGLISFSIWSKLRRVYPSPKPPPTAKDHPWNLVPVEAPVNQDRDWKHIDISGIFRLIMTTTREGPKVKKYC
jgi:hypothetical protein